MAEILSAIKSHLKLSDTDVDNWVFKLFSKLSVALCICGSLICVATQYFGDPIICDHHGVDGSIAKAYCWIHGSSYIRKEFEPHFGCVTTQDGLDDEADTGYYQWVIFVLILQGGLFMLPYQVWKFLEGGLMKGFDFQKTKSVIATVDDQLNDFVRRYVRYFTLLMGHSYWYFFQFVACEVFNLVVVVANFKICSAFLGPKWDTYGKDVLHYYSNIPYTVRRSAPNPMCEVFPTKVDCSIENYGPDGEPQFISGLCILSQNIINEKIFLVLWFWYVLLFTVSGFLLLYRAALICVPKFRSYLLAHHSGLKYSNPDVNRVAKKCRLGDWFILEQIARNTNKHFFRMFITDLAKEMTNGDDEHLNLLELKL